MWWCGFREDLSHQCHSGKGKGFGHTCLNIMYNLMILLNDEISACLKLPASLVSRCNIILPQYEFFFFFYFFFIDPESCTFRFSRIVSCLGEKNCQFYSSTEIHVHSPFFTISCDLQMEQSSGTVTVAGRPVAYVPQQAWLTQGTLRENILFGEPYEEKRLVLAL